MWSKVCKFQSSWYTWNVIWECSLILSIQIILTSCFRLIRLTANGLVVYEFLWAIYAWASTYVFCRIPYSFIEVAAAGIIKIQNHDNIHLMPNVFILSIGTGHIYILANERTLHRDLGNLHLITIMGFFHFLCQACLSFYFYLLGNRHKLKAAKV